MRVQCARVRVQCARVRVQCARVRTIACVCAMCACVCAVSVCLCVYVYVFVTHLCGEYTCFIITVENVRRIRVCLQNCEPPVKGGSVLLPRKLATLGDCQDNNEYACFSKLVGHYDTHALRNTAPHSTALQHTVTLFVNATAHF